MKEIMRYRGLLAVLAALLMAYPAFMFGMHIGDAVSDLPQDFHDHPVRVLFGFALNLVIVGAVTWATCIHKHKPASITNS